MSFTIRFLEFSLNIFRLILNMLSRFPAFGNALMYGTLFCSAEIAQQIVMKKVLAINQGKLDQEFDFVKLRRYAFLGYCVVPNMMTVWYRWLDTKYTGSTTRVVLKKVLLDQTCLTIPILFIFFSTMSYFEGQKEVTAEFFDKFPVTYMTSCGFWFPAQIINFKFVPPSQRIVFNGACGFIWANILCALKRL